MHSIRNKKNSSELLYSFLIILLACCLGMIASTKAGSFSSSVVKISSSSANNNNNNKQTHVNMQKSRDSTDEKSKMRQNQDQELPDEQRLLEFLLDNYDPASRPVFNASDSVEVRFGFSLVQLYDMDERNQILTTNVWLEQEWTDERLRWNASEYNNLDKVRIPCNRIWLPDIVLYNSADDYTTGYMQSKAMVKSNGEVYWPPPVKLRSSCKIDVTFFPFDDQICHIKFGSWTYSGLQLNLINKSNTTDLNNYIKSGEWELLSVTVQRNVQFYPLFPNEPYPDIVFYIHMRRRILYYLFNIILPCIWLSILILVGFWLPPDSGEKITLGITVLLAFSVFMLLIAENIPATSEMVPLIGIYLTTTMSLTSMSIILTVLVLQFHNTNKFTPIMSRRFYFFMTRRIGFLIGMKKTIERYEASHMMSERHVKLMLKSRHRASFYQSTVIEDELANLKTYWIDNHAESQAKSTATNISCLSCKRIDESVERLSIPNSSSNKNDLKRKEVPCQSTTSHGKSSNRFESVSALGNTQCSICKHINRSASNNNNNTHSTASPFPEQADRLIESIRIFNKNLKSFLNKQELTSLRENIQTEWKLIALIVDRLLFWIFMLLTVISSVCLLIVVPVLKNRNLIKPFSHDADDSQQSDWSS